MHLDSDHHVELRSAQVVATTKKLSMYSLHGFMFDVCCAASPRIHLLLLLQSRFPVMGA